MKGLSGILRLIWNHPLTRNHRARALLRFLRWQLRVRTFPYPFIYPFVENSRYIVKKGLAGATGNVYTGLHEFEDMAFTLHLLRPGDLFGDIGANIGSYTLLASAVAGAQSLSVEPIPAAAAYLRGNIAINDIQMLAECHLCAAGRENGTLLVTTHIDSANHVVTAADEGSPQLEVQVLTLDGLFVGRVPLLIKLDVEGFELEVLQGAGKLLQSPALRALIVELNGNCHRYATSEQDIDLYLVSYGFRPYRYEPFQRKLTGLQQVGLTGNTIYVRDPDWIRDRLETARKFTVLNQTF